MALVTTVARIVYLMHSSLMELSVALSLHFGWGSQLNTSEMFQIDMSRWMISKQMLMNKWSTCLGVVPITIEPLTIKQHNQHCGAIIILSIANCDLFTRAQLFIVFWERDITSEHHVTQVHITTSAYTSIIFRFHLLFCCNHYYLPSCVLILCKLQGQRD